MSEHTFDENLELSKSLTASVWERLENLGMAKGGPGSGPHKGGGGGGDMHSDKASDHYDTSDDYYGSAQGR